MTKRHTINDFEGPEDELLRENDELITKYFQSNEAMQNRFQMQTGLQDMRPDWMKAQEKATIQQMKRLQLEKELLEKELDEKKAKPESIEYGSERTFEFF